MPCASNCWIEIELLDEDDRGVAREPYWVRLPDGQVREGRLDENGFVRIDAIPCGTCTVRFPRTDGPEIRLAATQSPGTHWIEIRLLDEVDRPVRDEPYEVRLPDGSIRAGQLDANGRARLDGIPPGDCAVTFTRLDRQELVRSVS
jgi:hypothetical protein